MQERAGVAEVEGVEAFAKPGVDWGEFRARFVSPASVGQQARQAQRRAQLERSLLAPPRQVNRRTEVTLGLVRPRGAQLQLALESFDLGREECPAMVLF